MKTLVIGMCGNSLFYNKNTNVLLNEEPGGKGYNQAVGIKKLGGEVAFLGAIGNDESGQKCSNYLNSIGITNLLVTKEGKTTYATINVDDNGNNFIDVYNGVVLDYNDLDYIKYQISKYDIIMFQNEIPVELNKILIEYAYLNKKTIVVNPAPIAKWMIEFINKCYLITPNEEEARALFDIDNNIDSLEIGNYLLEKYSYNFPVNLLITLGSNGALLVKNNQIKHFNSLKVNPIDTTGAGDLMNASIVYGMMNNYTLEDSISLGTRACAYSVQRRYVLESYPTIEKIKT